MYDDEPGGSPTSGASPHWDKLAAIEPALLDLERDLRASVRTGLLAERWDCIDQIWHHAGFKRRLQRLIGWHASHPALSTCDAYNTAYQHLWGVMENCERSIAQRQVGC